MEQRLDLQSIMGRLVPVQTNLNTPIPIITTDGDNMTTIEVVPSELVAIPVANITMPVSSIHMANIHLNAQPVYSMAMMQPIHEHHHHLFHQESQQVLERRDVQEIGHLFQNKDALHGSQTSFWECLSHPAYVDITLIFEDGTLPINRAVLAAISAVVAMAVEDCHDSIVVPDMQMKDFFDFILIFTETSEELKEASLTKQIREVINILGIDIFKTKTQFSSELNTIKEHIGLNKIYDANSPIIHKKETIDPYAPGYAPGGFSQVTKIKKEVKAVSSDDEGEVVYKQNARIQSQKQPDSDHDFIDDDEASGVDEEFWGDDDYAPTKYKQKSTNKVKEDNDEKDTNQHSNCADLLLDTDDEIISAPTLDDIVAPFLNCHDCHQSGFSSMSDLISHFREDHEWSHSLYHCLYCDVPFMVQNSCAKHEKEHCKNTTNVCYKCGQMFPQTQELLSHLLKDHKHGVKRRCPHCTKNFLVLIPFHINKWSHPDKCQSRPKANAVGRPKGSKTGKGTKKVCNDCGGTYKDSWKHRRQCTAVNNDIKFTCGECKKGFRRLGAVKKHFKLFKTCKLNSKNQKDYQKLMKYVDSNIKGKTVCQDCGCEYVTRKGPQEHRKNCSSFTQFKCYACLRGMNAMDGFHIHFSKFPACREDPRNAEIVAEIVARSQKPEFHVCFLCGVQYKAKESIEKHMLSHSENVEYYHCKESDCKKKFITAKALEMHSKNHAMPKVICSICGKQVKQGSMPLHMILHTGKKIECPMCGKLFQHKGVLNKHIRTIHDEKKTPRAPRQRRKRVRKPKASQPKPMMAHVQGISQVQAIQVQVQPELVHQQQQHQLVRVSNPQEMPQDLRGPGSLVTVVSAGGGVNVHPPHSHPPTLQHYPQNVIIPGMPTHMHHALNTNNIQHFLQMSGQTRYTS